MTEAVAPHGFYYAPDPSSQQVCTIGGNVAENSGGAHCLKHGFTVTHVTGLEVVLPDGDVVPRREGARQRRARPDGRPDRLEGTLGIATCITLRVLRRPESVRTLLAGFDSPSEAGTAVSGVIAAGILAGAMEIMDRLTLEAAEAAVHPGYPDCGSVLIVELDGSAVQVEDDLDRVERICRECGAVEIRSQPTTPSAPSRGRGARPRSRRWADQPRLLRPRRCRTPHQAPRGARADRRSGAGVRAPRRQRLPRGRRKPHPLVLYDRRNEGEPARAKELAEAILEVCMDVGGSLTGEHGIGTDKACRMPLMFSEADLEVMQRLRLAFDPPGSAIRARSFRRRDCAARCPPPTVPTRSRLAGLAERL